MLRWNRPVMFRVIRRYRRRRGLSSATYPTIQSTPDLWVPVAPYRCPSVPFRATRPFSATYPNIPISRIGSVISGSILPRSVTSPDILNCSATSATILTTLGSLKDALVSHTATYPLTRLPISPRCTNTVADRLCPAVSTDHRIQDSRPRLRNWMI